MATQTSHFDMIKQQSNERVSVGLLNDNFDIIDGVMFANQEKSEQLADDYNASETYNTGDYVRRENYLYKCNTDNTTGTWDDTKWDRVKVMDEISQGGGGGSSTLAGLNDVNISSPTDGQALVFDNATQKWVNGAGGGGSSTFAGLNDVNVQGVANKDIARFNSSTNKWEKSSALTDLELAVSQISASTLGITEGHEIINPSGTAMAQEDGLQFASGCVEDDPVNGKTIYIEMIRISQANYNTLKANGQLKPGAKYFIYDAQPVAVNASNLPYSSTQSTKQKIDNVESSIPTSASNLPYSSGVSTQEAIYNITPRTRSDITSSSAMDALPLNSTILTWLNYSGAPYNNTWVTIRTFGTSTVKNQELVCSNGFAFRHYEAGAWNAWKKVNFS
jgi:flagellar basal body rod protein FlgF